jgi:hypothetical protein
MDFFGTQDTINTNMLPRVFFDRKAFVKYKISNNFEQTIDETDLKQPKIHTSLLILKISRHISANQKSRNFCPIFVISTQKSIPKGMDFKNL